MLAEAVASEETLTLADGAEIFYRAWHPPAASDRALLVFHRGHEHSGRMLELIEKLDLDGLHVFAWDARGHGRSSGARGFAESAGVLVR
ncbi:MAG: lysophospholipase, partial [Planctomycetes bacterium]|nr:lysophospholipase [Planctomycetota bacterium]